MATVEQATFMCHSTPRHNVLLITHMFCRFMVARWCWQSGGDFSGNLRQRLWIRAAGGVSGYHMATFDWPPLCAY